MITVTVHIVTYNGRLWFEAKSKEDCCPTEDERLVARHVFEMCQQFLKAIEAEGDAVPTKQNA